MSSILSDMDRVFWRTGLEKLLDRLSDGEAHYTHDFENISSAFSGKANRPLLRKCLRTLEADGLIENINLGFNIHKWKITDKGLKQTK